MTDESDKNNPGIERAIQVAKGQTNLAKQLGVSQGAVHKWLTKNCPAERAVEIEKATGVPRRYIRPDLYGDGANGNEQQQTKTENDS